MILRTVLPIAGLAIAIAYLAPGILQRQMDRLAEEDAPAVEATASTVTPAGPSPARQAAPILNGWDRRHIMQADASGHFRGTFVLNGKPVEAMIDTGATHVAINESTARRLGLQLIGSDFSHQVQTANGLAEVALATLHSVEIGPIRRENVPVLVLPDEALSTTLIGMSFLKELKTFEMARDRLDLQG